MWLINGLSLIETLNVVSICQYNLQKRKHTLRIAIVAIAKLHLFDQYITKLNYNKHQLWRKENY